MLLLRCAWLSTHVCGSEGAGGMQGTVLIKNAEELEGYSRSEENRLEALIKGIADSGARVPILLRFSFFNQSSADDILPVIVTAADTDKEGLMASAEGLCSATTCSFFPRLSACGCYVCSCHGACGCLWRYHAMHGRWWRPAAQSAIWRCTSSRNMA